MDKTFAMVKPDAVKRGLSGEIIRRFEQAGLKIIGLKMIWPDDELLKKHYNAHDEEYLKSLGNKTLATYEQFKIDPVKEIGTDDPLKLGTMVNEWLRKFVSSGPVIAMVLEGRHAVDNVRAICGPTMPVNAPAGSIRGDYSLDSAYYANTEKRPVMNLVHASGTPEEADFEIALWFQPQELHSYKRVEEYLTEK